MKKIKNINNLKTRGLWKTYVKASKSNEINRVINTENDNSIDKLVEIDSSIFNRLFAIAISKAALDSQHFFINLKKGGKQKSTNDEDEEEEDEDLNNLIKVFYSWFQCYKNTDQIKNYMGTMIVKEFNQKISDLLAIDFKTVLKLCERL